MAIECWRAGKGVGLLLVVIASFLAGMDFSSCQCDCYQFQASMWVEGGTSFSGGDPITICFSINAIPTCCDAGGIYVPLPCLEHLVAMVTIVNYPPNNAGPITLVSQEYSLHTMHWYCINGVVDCSTGSGNEMLILNADISCSREPVASVSTSCSFYVNCGEEPTPTPAPTSPPAPRCYDHDQDGYSNCQGDCNDYNPDIHPGAQDICDEIDNNCNGEIDEDCQESVISLEVSPGLVHVDESVFISGILSPSRAADIHLTFTRPDSTMFETTTTSNEEGVFSFSFNPDSPGEWSVSASAEGSLTYKAASSGKVSFTVKKITPTLSLKVDSTLLYPKEEITISGALSPPMTAHITVVIEDENGHKQGQSVSSDSDGIFSLSYIPDSVGKWSVSAHFDSNEKYESADSNTIFFTVTKKDSAVSVNVSTEHEIIEDNPIEITGQIRPPRSTSILIYLESENGERLDLQVLTREDGTFSYFYTPQSAGEWSVYVYVPEEEIYTSVTSDVFSFTVEPAIPDLAVAGFMIDLSPVEPGEEVKIHFRIENVGTGAAERITVHISADSEQGRTTIHEQYIARISAGSWTSIDVGWVVEYGIDALFVEIDPLQEIQELREDNNSTRHELEIVFTKDITITRIYFSEELEAGAHITITADLQCEGEIFSPFEVEFWDGKPENGLKIATETISNPSREISVEVPWTPESGDHEICVVVDSENAVYEYDEDNNTFENDVTVKDPPPIVETTVVVTATSAGIYLYLKNTARSLSRAVKRSPKLPHGSDEPLRHSGISKALEFIKGYGKGSLPLSPTKDLLVSAGKSIAATEIGAKLYQAKDILLRAGETTAATEIGAKLYQILYNEYYHWNKAHPVDFERMVQHKQDLLEKVITHLFIFEGYIDTEEFCRFFNVDESELLEILEFLHKNGYIERVSS